jgi:4Fe-4S binding domain
LLKNIFYLIMVLILAYDERMKLDTWVYQHRTQWRMVQSAMVLLFFGLLYMAAHPYALPLVTDRPWTHRTVGLLYTFWGIWFPGVFLSVIVLGRTWCGVLCPIGALSEWSSKIGWQRTIPAWLRSEHGLFISFTLITLLGQTLDVRDEPHGLCRLFLANTGVAVLLGFIYGKNKRIWCRSLCPIGGLLGLFARISALSLQPKQLPKRSERFRLKGVCPTFVDIANKQDSKPCIHCHRCIKPGSPGGLTFALRHPHQELQAIVAGQHHAYRATFRDMILAIWCNGLSLGGFLWLIGPWYQRMRMAMGAYAWEHHWYWINHTSWWLGQYPRQTYTLLDGITIITFMLMIAAILTFFTIACVMISCKGQRSRRVQHAHTLLPVLLLTLGWGLLDLFWKPFTTAGIVYLKSIGWVIGALWSTWAIVPLKASYTERCWLGLGVIVIVAGWWPVWYGWPFT